MKDNKSVEVSNNNNESVITKENKMNTVNISEIMETLNNNSKRKGSGKFKLNRVYVQRIPEDLSTIRLSPQAIKIVQAILEDSSETWNEPELFEVIDAIPELSKRQDNWKIFTYYRKSLIECGFLSMETSK